MPDKHFIIRGGIGDVLPILNRIITHKNNLTNDAKIHLYLGGYKTVPYLCEQIVNAQPWIFSCTVIKNYNNFNLSPQIKKMIQDKNPNDEVQIFDVMDAFLNQREKTNFENLPLSYPWQIKIPDDVKKMGEKIWHTITDRYTDKQFCGIQIATTIGSEDFDHNGKRFLSKDIWIKFFELLNNENIIPIFFGNDGDCNGIPISNYGISLLGQCSILESIYLLYKPEFFVGTNSWMWSARAIAGKHSICTYFTNQFWMRLQIPDNIENFKKHCFIYTESKNCTAELMLQKLKELQK